MRRPDEQALQTVRGKPRQTGSREFQPQENPFETRDLYSFRVDAEWHFNVLHEGIAELVGYSREDFENGALSWLDIVHPEDKELVLDAKRRGLATDRYYSAEYRIVTKETMTRWVKMRGSILCDKEGAFLCIQGIMNDITPQKDTEAAIESDHEIFRRFANGMNDGVYIVSSDYRIKFMNKTLINLLGDHVGELCHKVLFKRDTPCPWSVMNRIKEQMCGYQEYNLPVRNQVYQVASFPIRFPDKSIGKLGLFRNLSEIKRLQEELVEFVVRHQAIQAAADKANIAIAILQDQGGIEALHRYVNEAYCRITGYSTEELLNMGIGDILHPDDRQKGLGTYRARLRGEKLDMAYERRITRKDGEVITTLLSGARSIYNREVAVFLFLRDITERKKMEASMWLSQRLASIGRLAAEIAHEINNPLTSVLTFNQLMGRIIGQEPFPVERVGELRDYIGFLGAEAGRCAEIARNLLDFSRQGEINFKENNINEILIKTVDVMRHPAEMKGIQIVTSYAPDLPQVYCDFRRLQQAVVNLIMNAFEAMPNGGVLSVSTEFIRDQSMVILTISDTGTGISAENLGKVFEPFFTSKAEGKGVGLGLSVAYGIIQQHHGEIHVQSEVGKGTTFSVHLRGDVCMLPED
jgi:PAS domain S-box-containing protein